MAAWARRLETLGAVRRFDYLKPPGKGGVLRSEVLRALTTPILFVQGTRDPLCPLDSLEGVREKMRARHRLHVVDGGDHSLRVGKTDLKRQGRTQDDIEGGILAAIRTFVAEVDP
jgi:predicted alpha/beta-hydrolase family hydrolase